MCQKESTDHIIHFGAPFFAASRRNRFPITSGSNSNYVGTVRRSQHQSEKINENRSVNHFTVTSLSQELHENSARNKECRENFPRTEIVRDQRCNKTVRTVSRLNRKTNLNRSRAPRASNEEQMRTPIVIRNPKGGTFRPRSNTPPCLDFRTQIIYLYIFAN